MEKQIREYVTLNTPSSDKRRLIRCELGDYVAVYLKEDQGWERGRIVRVNKKSLSADHVENKFEIYLLDQGNTSIVHQENISALPLHLNLVGPMRAAINYLISPKIYTQISPQF